ncbi:DoxX family protein [Microbispora sp. NPDC049633]|uniref:DoxX family protein n=1 Tax=Microbispora sp. NPDC049633 TaxID=3154355 RepID=UPI00341F31C8
MNERPTLIEKAQPIALLLARVGLGTIFIANGWEKFAMSGISGTTAFFKSVGVPLPAVSAVVIATLELAGGVALVLGLLLPVVGTLLTLDMLGAIVFVHGSKGFFIADDGVEFVLGLAAASLAIAFSGGGALAADNLWRGRRTKALEHKSR